MEQQTISRIALIWAILRKDALQFSRNKLYMALSIVALTMFIAAFWMIPPTVDEFAVIAVSYRDLGPLEAAFKEAGSEGLKVLIFPDEDSLARVIAKTAQAWIDTSGQLVIVDRDDRAGRPKDGKREQPGLGLVFPETFLPDILSGRTSTVRLLVNHDTPAELQGAMSSMVREMVYLMTGHSLPVSEPAAETVILGTDRTGAQIPMRDRMRPMLAFFVLMMETFAMSALIAVEILHRTVVAVIATPARKSDVLIAKVIFGSMLAFGQAGILLLAVGAFGSGNILILLAAVLTGALMFSGIAMLVGSMGKDFMGTLAWTMIIIIPFGIPAFSALFPGSSPLWVRFVPSWGIIEILNVTANYGAGWSEVAPHFAVAIFWLVALLGLGLLTLSRKVARL
jgi:ABC-2 type transport system permease protein